MNYQIQAVLRVKDIVISFKKPQKMLREAISFYE